MTTSCGVLLTNGTKVLICHPTGNDFWNIPKGMQDDGEIYLKTAIRELKEETGLEYPEQNYTFLGKFKYLEHKDLVLFLVMTSTLPDISSLKCHSTFKQDGKHIPEHDGFQYVTWDKAESLVNEALAVVIRTIRKDW